LDYFVWGVFELLFKASKENQGPHPEVEVVMWPLERGTVAKAYWRLMFRMEAVVATDSHFIE
jgi:hypothetical protein